MTPGRAVAGQKMGAPVHVPLQSIRRDPLPEGLHCGGPGKPWGPRSTISCRGEPSGARPHPNLCFLSPELGPAAVSEAAPPWLQPVARGWCGPRSCRPALPWPCSASWSTWAPCALPADGTRCPRPLCFLGTGLGAPRWHVVAARGDPACACPELGSLGSAALLTPNPQLQPQCKSAWPDPAPLCLVAPRRVPCTQRPCRSSLERAELRAGWVMPGVMPRVMPAVPGTAQWGAGCNQDLPRQHGPCCRAGEGAGLGRWGVPLLQRGVHGDAHRGQVGVPGHPLLAPGLATRLGLSLASPRSKGRKKKVPPDGVKLVDEVSVCWRGGQDQPRGSSGPLSSQPRA